MTVIVLLFVFVFLYILWVPLKEIPINERPAIKKAYERMNRVLSRIERLPDGTITVDDSPVEERLSAYYKHYAVISEYIKRNPGDIDGAYERV